MLNLIESLLKEAEALEYELEQGQTEKAKKRVKKLTEKLRNAKG